MPRKRQTYEITCENCRNVVERSNCNGKAPRFCSKSCSNVWQHKNCFRRTYCADKTIEEWRDVHRTLDEVNKRLRLIEIAKATRDAHVAVYKANHPWKGSSIETRLGLEKAAGVRKLIGKANTGKKRSTITRAKMSSSMRKRMLLKPETVVSHGIKGWYKGFFFRSSYEYFFMKKLEREGLSIQSDVNIEHFQIPYVWNGEHHTYIPDVYVPSRGTVYEVKSYYASKDPQVLAKADAARAFLKAKGVQYEFVTERDLNIPRARSIRSLMNADPCVFMLPKSEQSDVPDKLDTLFSEQERFMRLLQEKRALPKFPADLTTKDGQRLVKDISHDCMHELFEAIHLLADAKNHRKTIVGGFDREKFVEELADVLHYFIEICMLVGITRRELYYAFMKKGTINFARILGGY